jgi:stage V sporulation protein B
MAWRGDEILAQSKDIIRGTLILVAGNIAVKIIGALFKLPLANIIGADGMGLYNAAFIVYDIFLVLATAGCPLAVSKLVASCSASGRGSEPLRILRVSRFCFFIIGSLLSAVMFFGAGLFRGLSAIPEPIIPSLCLRRACFLSR